MSLATNDILDKCSVEVANEFLDSDHCIISIKVNLPTNVSSWSSPWALNRADWLPFCNLCNAEINNSLISKDIQKFYYQWNSTIISIAD